MLEDDATTTHPPCSERLLLLVGGLTPLYVPYGIGSGRAMRSEPGGTGMASF